MMIDKGLDAPASPLRLRPVILGFFVALLASIVLTFSFQWISADAPYYLALARDISNGSVLYKDATNAYNPLVIYLFTLPFELFAAPSYSIFLAMQLIVIVLGGLCLYAILCRLGISADTAQLASLIFCVAVLSSDGQYINLESYSVLLVLCALYTLLVWDSAFLCGFLIGGAFLCKQYSIVNFIPVAFWIIVMPGKVGVWKKLITLCTGGLVPVLALLMTLLLQGVDMVQFLSQVSGVAYANYSVERGRNVLSVLIGAKVFLLLMVVPLYYFARTRRVDKLMTFAIIGICVNLLPVIVRSFQHYFINAIPFAVMLTALVIQEGHLRRYAVLFIVSGVIAVGLFTNRLVKYAEVGEQQRVTAEILRVHLPDSSSVFIEGPMRYLYFLNDYRNPLLQTVGYNYAYFVTDRLVGSTRNYSILSFREYSPTGIRVDTPSGIAYIYRNIP